MAVRDWVRWSYELGFRHGVVAVGIGAFTVSIYSITILAADVTSVSDPVFVLAGVGVGGIWVGGLLASVRERVALSFWLFFSTVVFFLAVVGLVAIEAIVGIELQPAALQVSIFTFSLFFASGQLFMAAVGGAVRPFTRWRKPEPLPEEQVLSNDELSDGGYFEKED